MKILWLAFFLTLSFSLFSQEKKALIIGIDGCRADALLTASTPNIDALIANSTYSMDALTEPPTWSGVGWSGMLTGVWKDKHGVNDNSFAGSNYGTYPHFFNRLEIDDPILQTESVVHWGPINSEIVDLIDYEFQVSSDAGVRDEAIDRLSNFDPDVLFLHFDDVDHEGHFFGFHPTVPQYLSAIEGVDAHVGQIISALTSRPNYANEDWVIVLSTDHGGTFSGHGGNSLEEQNIFLIVSGDNVPNQEIGKTESQSTFTNHVNYNGASTFALVGNPAVGNFGTQDFTIECRVKSSGWSGDPAIISNKNWDNGFFAGYVFSCQTDGSTWKLNLGDGFDRLDLNGGEIADGEWHHLSASFDRDGYAKIFQDGILLDSALMGAIGNLDTGLDLCFGQDGTQSYTYFYNGSIAEVRLWNAALPDGEIENFSCQSLVSHPSVAELRAHWACNEGSGNILNDAISGANATLMNPLSWDPSQQTIACLDYSNTPRITDVAVSVLKHMGISIEPAWNLDGNCVGVQPPTCAITSILPGIQSGCSALDNSFVQELIIEYENIGNNSQLDINGQLFQVENSPQHLVLSDLESSGLQVDVNAFFTQEPGCFKDESSLFLAPSPCTTCVGDLNNDGLIGVADLLNLLAVFGDSCD